MKRASHGPLTASRPAAAQDSPVPSEMEADPGLLGQGGWKAKPRRSRGFKCWRPRHSLRTEWLRVPALTSPFTPAWKQGLTFILQGLYPQDLRVRARGCISLLSTGG